MKKPAIVLLILSLLANIALAIVVVRMIGFPSTLTTPFPKTAAAAQTPATPTPHIITDASLAAALKTDDTKSLLNLLKEAGFSDHDARWTIFGLEYGKFMDQSRALNPTVPYWRNHPVNSDAVRLKSQQLREALLHATQDLFINTASDPRDSYSYLTPERRAQLIELEQDYNDLIAETDTASGGFRLQSDTDQLKTLVDAKKQVIDSFLTPDEIAARDIRESPTATLIRNDYGAVIDNETEYQTIYNLMQSAGADPDAQAAARSQIESMLGPDRMANLAQMNDYDYTLIQHAAARLNLPADTTTASLMNIRNQAQQASADIAADTTLTPAQRAAALQDLAAKSQDQMTSVLGAEGAAAFAKSSSWMNALKRSEIFNYDTRGKFHSKK